MRLACDTGGTFTDLMVEEDEGVLRLYKAPTTPEDPIEGVLNALRLAAADRQLPLAKFLAQCDLFIHGTTHAINAIITGKTARTAFLTTQGHPDILVLREGGRLEPFNFLVPYPEPYVPRALTFEIPERINAAGQVVLPLDEAEVMRVIERLRLLKVEAVSVCLLWAIANPAHEDRIGELLAEHLPGVPFTLAHRLNPVLREYRRASSAAIDASLKPLMQTYLGNLSARLSAAGFSGRTLVLTSQGGMMDAAELAEQPIQAVKSGPSMAPIAGRHYAGLESGSRTVIIADTGGTTYDVSLVRHGHIPKTRETWIGPPFRGHMTGFPSIDIKSVGAGGGSIASIDSGGMLHVGPKSAGAVPGPVCYGAGGVEPTLTDACLVLGYIDQDFFLGGAIKLDREAARRAVAERIAAPMNVDVMRAAAAIVAVATENMVQAIEEITVNQGIDPSEAILLGGGGAAGLNSVFVARRLGCPMLLIPETGAALSAAGALMSDLRAEFREMFFTTSDHWHASGVTAVLDRLEGRCRDFAARVNHDSGNVHIEFSVEARYASQVWEIEVPLPEGRLGVACDLSRLVERFHDLHEQVFAVRDTGSAVEFVGWNAAVTCPVRRGEMGRLRERDIARKVEGVRSVYFEDAGLTETPVLTLQSLPVEEVRKGPAIIETPFTTIVIDPCASFRLAKTGNLIITP